MITKQKTYNTIRAKHKTPLALLCLLFLCLAYNQGEKTDSSIKAVSNFNTKILISHLSHTCSASDIDTQEVPFSKRETEFAITKNRYFALDNDENGILFSYDKYLKRYSLIYSSSIKDKESKYVSCKSLQQLGTLLI
ncbi:MAG: hypothetical protein IJ180_04015 [Bacteroidales bacterium]|nr:hypothetical protein [Bacteroidales bacterium]